MELAKIIGEVKPYMKAKINCSIKSGFREGFSPEPDFVNYFFLRP